LTPWTRDTATGDGTRVAISLARGRVSTWGCLCAAPSQSSTPSRTTGDGWPTSRYVRSQVPLLTGLREMAAWSACAPSSCSSTSIPKWRWTEVWTRSKSLTDRKLPKMPSGISPVSCWAVFSECPKMNYSPKDTAPYPTSTPRNHWFQRLTQWPVDRSRRKTRLRSRP
jgi:hypothetical protein